METNCEACVDSVITENSSKQDKQDTPPPPPPVTVKEKESKSAAESGGRRSCRDREEKLRKKDDKSMEQVLKALNSLHSPEEKLAAMCKKYADIIDENRKLQLSVKQGEKKLSAAHREKEQLQAEYSKAVLGRTRMESLCRELQRQNKQVKDESLLKIREEEERRKEVSGKFQTTLNEITALMNQNKEKNAQLRDDNIEMTQKLKSVCEQYELREQQVEKIKKQMQLEGQLAEAKLAKLSMEMAAEREILLRDKHNVMKELNEYKSRCVELEAMELGLRQQLSLYTDKYDEFQSALSRSNEVFNGFKGEMEKMSKKITKLEKETSSWKQRWEKSHQALLEMAADKQQRDNELALATRQLAQLQKLCRTLQKERSALLSQLKATSAASVPWEDSNQESCINEGVKKVCEELTESLDQLGQCCMQACEAQAVQRGEPSVIEQSDELPSAGGNCDAVTPMCSSRQAEESTDKLEDEVTSSENTATSDMKNEKIAVPSETESCNISEALSDSKAVSEEAEALAEKSDSMVEHVSESVVSDTEADASNKCIVCEANNTNKHETLGPGNLETGDFIEDQVKSEAKNVESNSVVSNTVVKTVEEKTENENISASNVTLDVDRSKNGVSIEKTLPKELKLNSGATPAISDVLSLPPQASLLPDVVESNHIPLTNGEILENVPGNTTESDKNDTRLCNEKNSMETLQIINPCVKDVNVPNVNGTKKDGVNPTSPKKGKEGAKKRKK